ncbi:MAG: hypothetical protein HY070_02395 [Chloroflexi bacterium]|nr:hypothetical protein [Chloroflexota bacterium]
MKAVIALGLVIIAIMFGVGALALTFNASDRAAQIETDAPTDARAVAQSEEPMSTVKGIVEAIVKPQGPLAPEIASATWLNSPALSSAQLRGKVVVIEFWTYG